MKSTVFWYVALCRYSENRRSSEMSVYTISAWPHIPEDGTLHSRRRGNLKSYKVAMMIQTFYQKLYI
jgi:hypothetical protein